MGDRSDSSAQQDDKVTFDVRLGIEAVGRIRDIPRSTHLDKLREDKIFNKHIGAKDVQFCLRNGTPISKKVENDYTIADIINVTEEPWILVTDTTTGDTILPSIPTASIPAQQLAGVPKEILSCIGSKSTYTLLAYVWGIEVPKVTPKEEFTAYRKALEQDPSFYKVDFPIAINPMFAHTDGVRKIDMCMTNDNPLLTDSTIHDTAMDILNILDTNSSLGQQHVTTVIAPTASGKTTAAFLVATQTWTIYMEVPDPMRGSKSVYGDAMEGLLSDREWADLFFINRGQKDKEAYLRSAVLRNIYTRALALLCLFTKGRIVDPSSWLLGQIDGFSSYVQAIYKKLKSIAITRVELNELLDDLKQVLPQRQVGGKLIQAQLTCIIDEAQVLMSEAYGEYSVSDHPDKKWSFLQFIFTELLNFNISQVFMGTEFRMAHNTALATALLKSLAKDRIKIYVVTRFQYLSQAESRERLSQLIELQRVAAPVVDKISWNLTGRPRPLPSFVVYFSDLRRWKGPKGDPTEELEECFDEFCKYVWLPELLAMLKNLRGGIDVPRNLALLLKADVVRGFGGVQPTTDVIPLLEWGICPMQGHRGALQLDISKHKDVNLRTGGHECLKDSTGTVFTYGAQPLEPMMLRAIQLHLGPEVILRHMVHTFGEVSNAQGRGIEFNSVVMATFMHLAEQKRTLGDVLADLALGQKFQYAKWVPLHGLFKAKHMVQPHKENVLAPFLFSLAKKARKDFCVEEEYTNKFPGLYGRSEYMPGVGWEEVGIISEELAGTDGVCCVQETPTAQNSAPKPVIISFGAAVYPNGVPLKKYEYQEFRSDLKNQYLHKFGKGSTRSDFVHTLHSTGRKFGEYHLKAGNGTHQNTYRRRIINNSLEVLGGHQIIFLFEIPQRSGALSPVLQRYGDNLIVTVDERNMHLFFGEEYASVIKKFALDACYSDKIPDGEEVFASFDSAHATAVVGSDAAAIINDDAIAEGSKRRRTGQGTHKSKRSKNEKEIDNGQEQKKYVVEKILQHKKFGNTLKYEVKWKGYSETTWEPASSFDDRSILDNYHLKR